jgi:ABC-type uncharacterized transport system substrate-binding protein
MVNIRGKRWTPREDNLFRRMAEANSHPELIAARLNRSVQDIKTRAYTIGLPLKWFKLKVKGNDSEALRRGTKKPVLFETVTDPVGLRCESGPPWWQPHRLQRFRRADGRQWLEMLTQIMPPVVRVAVLFNPSTAPQAGLMLRAIEDAAPSFAVEVRPAPVQDDSEIEAMMAGLERDERGGVLVLAEIFTWVNRDAIVAAAARHRLPAIYYDRSFVAAA